MANEEQTPRSRTDGKKKRSLPIASTLCMVFALIAMGLGAMAIISVSDLDIKFASRMRAFAEATKDQLEKNVNVQQSEINPEQINSVVSEKLSVFYRENRNQIAGDVAKLLPPPEVGEFDEDKLRRLINTSIQTLYGNRLQTAENNAIQAKSAADNAQFTANNALDAYQTLSNKVEDVASSRPSPASGDTLKRLKEFNIIEVLKDGALFVVDAPKKNGRDNSITLVVGEAFYSKVGHHKVEKALEHNGQYRLVISGGYFIDNQREEFTQSELKAMAKPKSASSSEKSKGTMEEKNNAQVNKDTSGSAKLANNKMYLRDWKIITPIRESSTVVAYDTVKNKPMQLQKGKYVQGVGTVQNIDFTTGETCFETYCIQGLQ